MMKRPSKGEIFNKIIQAKYAVAKGSVLLLDSEVITADAIELNCPAGHGPLGLETIAKKMTFRGVDIEFQVESYVCAECNLEVGTIGQSSNTQKAISNAYREKAGLLTSEEIQKGRRELGLTQ